MWTETVHHVQPGGRFFIPGFFEKGGAPRVERVFFMEFEALDALTG
jgi:hypothetical protein